MVSLLTDFHALCSRIFHSRIFSAPAADVNPSSSWNGIPACARELFVVPEWVNTVLSFSGSLFLHVCLSVSVAYLSLVTWQFPMSCVTVTAFSHKSISCQRTRNRYSCVALATPYTTATPYAAFLFVVALSQTNQRCPYCRSIYKLPKF